MKKILVLGITGMLGSMIYNYLKKNPSFSIAGSHRGEKNEYFNETSDNIYFFDSQKDISSQVETIIKQFEPDYIINAIGIIKPHCMDNDMKGVYNAITVNSIFPHELSKVVNNLDKDIRIIQIATDCVYSGKKGNYNESDKHDALDVYGKTKSLGEVISDNFLNIRCSILGPEIKGKLSLLEWFLSNPKGASLKGFAHHKWNGITTLQFAKLCEDIISNNEFDHLRSLSPVLHHVKNSTVNKFELLNLLAKTYHRDYTIEYVDNIGDPVDRTISSKFLTPEIIDMSLAIKELSDFNQNISF